jgi:hypothetical protein
VLFLTCEERGESHKFLTQTKFTRMGCLVMLNEWGLVLQFFSKKQRKKKKKKQLFKIIIIKIKILG